MKEQVIGIICALDIEIEAITKVLNYRKRTEVRSGLEFYLIQHGSCMLVITKCGIGKVNAGIVTTLLIEHYQPDLIINSGIAGGFNTCLKTLDVVIATSVVYIDVDMTNDVTTDLRFGQLQDMPLEFKPHQQLIDKLHNANLSFKPYFGAILSGDKYQTNHQEIETIVDKHFNDFDVYACDMESCAIAHACYLFNVPFIIVRAISDVIGSTNPFEYQTFGPVASKNAAEIVKNILEM